MKIDRAVLYRYTVKEDIFNAVSHGVGVLISYIGLIYLVSISSTTREVVAVSVYATCLLLMFLFSTLYHAIFNDMARSILKRLDHCGIFLLITASYVPFTFLVLNTTASYIIFSILIVLTIIGIVIKVFYVGKFKKISTLVFVIMGWLIVFQIQDIYNGLSMETFVYLVLGGVLYTVGAIFYALANFKYHHFIWHLFVLAAAICHFISIANIIN